ncbi:hypothetical protein ACFFX0_25570 [Citricoccus parietis]|uniref:Uncharacterized protein n=1 Tax=Citricoccus parietis TaxID=592307 RepID=A0ABV5G651_9MICC
MGYKTSHGCLRERKAECGFPAFTDPRRFSQLCIGTSWLESCSQRRLRDTRGGYGQAHWICAGLHPATGCRPAGRGPFGGRGPPR